MKTLQRVASIKKIEQGSIITPQGYKTAGVHAGLRYSKKDLGIILSDIPASVAAVYTQSVIQAAPLEVTKQSIQEEGKLQGIIVNSACANACTGKTRTKRRL